MTVAVQVWVVATDPEPGLEPGGWRSLLDQEETADATRRRRPSDRVRYIARHVALRTILGRHLGVDPAAVVFARAACPLCGAGHGRPVLRDRDDVSFSLAATEGAVVVAIAPVAVGVDVETTGRVSAHDLAAAFDRTERAGIDGLRDPERSIAALRCWVRKEALLKGWGTGLGIDPETVHVGVSAMGPAPQQDGWVLADVPLDSGRVAAVAYQSPVVAEVEVLTLDLPSVRRGR